MVNYKIALEALNCLQNGCKQFDKDQWEIAGESDDMNIACDWGYHGMAFVNHETKEILFASKGTDFKFPLSIPYPSLIGFGTNLFAIKFLAGLPLSLNFAISAIGLGVYLSAFSHNEISELMFDGVSNTQIYLGVTPIQYYIAKDFVQSVLENIPDAHSYSIITTGHSLGAPLSNLINLQLTSEGYKVSSINFDSPGSKYVLLNYINSNKINVTIDQLNVITIKSPDNLINTLLEEIGEIFETYVSPGKGIATHYFENIFNQLKEGEAFFTIKEAPETYLLSSDLSVWINHTPVEQELPSVFNVTELQETMVFENITDA